MDLVNDSLTPESPKITCPLMISTHKVDYGDHFVEDMLEDEKRV
jgi:hypothetical protein